MRMLKTGDLLVGSGDGMLTLCNGTNFKMKKLVGKALFVTISTKIAQTVIQDETIAVMAS